MLALKPSPHAALLPSSSPLEPFRTDCSINGNARQSGRSARKSSYQTLGLRSGFGCLERTKSGWGNAPEPNELGRRYARPQPPSRRPLRVAVKHALRAAATLRVAGAALSVPQGPGSSRIPLAMGSFLPSAFLPSAFRLPPSPLRLCPGELFEYSITRTLSNTTRVPHIRRVRKAPFIRTNRATGKPIAGG